LIEIINKQLLLQLVGYLCYWQMGFSSVFKGLIATHTHTHTQETPLISILKQISQDYISTPNYF